MLRFLHVVGARPNFMKAAPVWRAIARYAGSAEQVLVHTGQHYDASMSDVFFRELELPSPDVNLGVGSGSHAQQTAAIISGLEPVLEGHRADFVVVYGDVNSTIAAALVAAKLGIRIVHVEAGLRSFDRSMPEEINRILTDQLSDLLFTPSEDGDRNLLREGIAASKIYLVGNVMIDTLKRLLPQAERYPLPGVPQEFALFTLHRAANVDDVGWLEQILGVMTDLASRIPVLFPVHPRTASRIKSLGRSLESKGLHFMKPVSYLEFLALQRRARVVVTDSGGIQEETTFLGVPCFTLRDNTERPITVSLGTNVLVGRDPGRLNQLLVKELEQVRPQVPPKIPLWDGLAGERISEILLKQA